jgi:hypothetical protein
VIPDTCPTSNASESACELRSLEEIGGFPLGRVVFGGKLDMFSYLLPRPVLWPAQVFVFAGKWGPRSRSESGSPR